MEAKPQSWERNRHNNRTNDDVKNSKYKMAVLYVRHTLTAFTLFTVELPFLGFTFKASDSIELLNSAQIAAIL